MNHSSSKTTKTIGQVRQGSAAKVLIVVLVQTAIVILLAVALMFALRGNSAEDQLKERFSGGAGVTPPTNNPSQGIPPVAMQWPTEEAMLAAAPDVPLVEKTYTIEEEEFTIMVPEGTEFIEGDGLVDIKLRINPHADIKFIGGECELKDRMRQYRGGNPFPFLNDDILVAEKKSDEPNRFDFLINTSIGLEDFFITAGSEGAGYPYQCTLEDCLLMLKCVRTIKAKRTLPTNPVEFFEATKLKITKNDAGEIIGLEGYSFTRPVMAKLAEVPKLERLVVDSNSLLEKNFTVFEKLPNLKELNLDLNGGISDPMLDAIVQCKKLEKLDLQIHPATAETVAKIGDLKQLRTLRLDGFTKDNFEGLAKFEQLTKLEVLSLKAHDVWPEGAFAFTSSLPELKQLSIDGDLTDQVMASLANATSCESLYLYDIQISDAGLKPLGKLTNLTSLSLIGPSAVFKDRQMTITNDGLAALETLVNLERFSLEGAAIDDAALDHLAKLPNLKKLYLDRTKITDAGLEKLGSWENLKVVSLSDNEMITKEALDKFYKEHPNLGRY